MPGTGRRELAERFQLGKLVSRVVLGPRRRFLLDVLSATEEKSSGDPPIACRLFTLRLLAALVATLLEPSLRLVRHRNSGFPRGYRCGAVAS